MDYEDYYQDRDKLENDYSKRIRLRQKTERLEKFQRENIDRCIECGSINVIDNVCRDCGLIQQENGDFGFVNSFVPINNSPEYSELRYNSHNGGQLKKSLSPITPETVGLGFLTSHSKNTHNRELKRAFYHEKRYVKDYNEKELLTHSIEMKRIVSQLDLPDIVFREAFNVLKSLLKINKNFFVKYKDSKNAVQSLCIKIGAKIHKIKASLREIIPFLKNSEKHLIVYYFKIKKEFQKYVSRQRKR